MPDTARLQVNLVCGAIIAGVAIGTVIIAKFLGAEDVPSLIAGVFTGAVALDWVHSALSSE